MRPTCWQQLQELVNATVELPAGEREEFLRSACGNDRELQRQVEELIQSFEATGSYLENAVVGYAEKVLGGGSPVSSPIVGEQIGAYQLMELIGEGGMGSVYRATRADDQFRQVVAIKVMRPGFGATDELAARFRAERQILANLSHPNVARLLDGGITGGRIPYLVMEYIDGQSIDRYVAAKRLSVNERLRLFRQVCAAIQYAHQNLVVHRDIKPANVLVTSDGIPKLLDFGIAKLLNPDALVQTVAWTRPAERLMTPEYASPEQIKGETITTATDVYGLGALLYELLTYKRPFQISNLTPASIERLICESSPERPSTATSGHGSSQSPGVTREVVPTELDNVVFKAMHKEPARRYVSAAELSEDLRRYLEGFPIIARADSWRYRARKFVVRHRMGTAIAAVFVFTVTSLSIGVVVQARRAADQAGRALREARATSDESNFAGTWQHEPSADPLLFESFVPTETQGRTPNAREILDRATSRVSGEMGGRPIIEARLLQMLGTTYYSLGLPSKAEPLLSQAYRLQSKALGPNSPEAVSSLAQLAEIKSSKGEFGQALQDFRTALDSSIAINGWNSDQTAFCLGGFANALWMAGKLEEASNRYRQQIAILTKLNGGQDPRTLRAKSDLEVVLAQAGHFTAAETLAREVLASRLRTLGPNHPIVGRSMLNLAALLARTDRYAEAQALAEKALDLFRRNYGPLYPEDYRSLRVLGEIARQMGHYAEAEHYDAQALDTSTKLRGPMSCRVGCSQDELVLDLLDEGDLRRARSLSTSILTSELSDSSTSKPALATGYDHAGLVDLEAKHLAAARRDFTKALALREAFYGPVNDRVALTLEHLGDVLYAGHEYASAEQRYRDAVRMGRAIFPGPHTLTAEALYGLGKTLLAEGHRTAAEEALRESLAMRRELLPAGHPDIAKSETALRQVNS